MTAAGAFEKWKAVRAEMLERFQELWDDPQALRDTVEGETGISVEALVIRAAEEILLAEALAAGCAARAKDMSARAARLTKKVNAGRELLILIMAENHKKTVVSPTATITLKATAPVVLTLAESDIPSKYWKDHDPTLDKIKLKADLVAGIKIEGAIMSDPGTTVAIKGS